MKENKDIKKKKTTSKKDNALDEKKKPTSQKKVKQQNKSNKEVKKQNKQPKTQSADLKAKKQSKTLENQHQKESKSKKESKKSLSKKQIVLISVVSAVMLVAILAVTLCFVFIKPQKPQTTLQAISVKAAGKVSGYSAFEEFDKSGLVIEATYSDNSKMQILEGYTISYVSQSSSEETLHSDYFYGGETKIKISYQGKNCYLDIEEVAKIESELEIKLERYSALYTSNSINFPSENVNVTNSQGQMATNANYQLFYCKEFNDFNDYQPTNTDDGAVSVGGAPSNEGTYKVFAKLVGDKNYLDKFSDAVEFNIVDAMATGLFASSGEEFFAFKEQTIPASINPYYIEFELVEEANEKYIKYHSTFAGTGKTLIFSDGIELVSNGEKTQISLNNSEILLKNSQKTLKMWNIPAYLGTYERVVTPEYVAENFGLTLAEEQTCSLKIYVEDELKDGKVYFELDILWRNGETLEKQKIDGTVVYSTNQSGEGNLSFNIENDGLVTKLFDVSGINEDNRMENIYINLSAIYEADVSSGIYENII